MRLPKSVQEIAEVIGRDRALFLVGKLPRFETSRGEQVLLYVPHERRMKPDHQLVRILGWNDAVKMCRAFGGEILKPGNCQGIYQQFRKAEIRRRVAAGESVKTLAEIFAVTDRHVRALAKEIPPEDLRAANDNNDTNLTPAYMARRIQ
ncbi:hypothetical protein AB7813_08315 [Tardiphaga sp. 20_F10_N6_6]|uniref:hypothetical protein n=1 Tax=Tardiphaga sp. 20_F10_N6_6 TaxID=3240788 RepID=UPI003F89C2BA